MNFACKILVGGWKQQHEWLNARCHLLSLQFDDIIDLTYMAEISIVVLLLVVTLILLLSILINIIVYQ